MMQAIKMQNSLAKKYYTRCDYYAAKSCIKLFNCKEK